MMPYLVIVWFVATERSKTQTYAYTDIKSLHNQNLSPFLFVVVLYLAVFSVTGLLTGGIVDRYVSILYFVWILSSLNSARVISVSYPDRFEDILALLCVGRGIRSYTEKTRRTVFISARNRSVSRGGFDGVKSRRHCVTMLVSRWLLMFF